MPSVAEEESGRPDPRNLSVKLRSESVSLVRRRAIFCSMPSGLRKGFTYEYKEKDVILYNLGLGARPKDLKWVFEGHGSFEVLPTFGLSWLEEKWIRENGSVTDRRLQVYFHTTTVVFLLDLRPCFQTFHM